MCGHRVCLFGTPITHGVMEDVGWRDRHMRFLVAWAVLRMCKRMIVRDRVLSRPCPGAVAVPDGGKQTWGRSSQVMRRIGLVLGMRSPSHIPLPD